MFVIQHLPCFQLFYHLQREGPFPEPRALFYAAEMALALGYLHSLGVVYRYHFPFCPAISQQLYYWGSFLDINHLLVFCLNVSLSETSNRRTSCWTARAT